MRLEGPNNFYDVDTEIGATLSGIRAGQFVKENWSIHQSEKIHPLRDALLILAAGAFIFFLLSESKPTTRIPGGNVGVGVFNTPRIYQPIPTVTPTIANINRQKNSN